MLIGYGEKRGVLLSQHVCAFPNCVSSGATCSLNDSRSMISGAGTGISGCVIPEFTFVHSRSFLPSSKNSSPFVPVSLRYSYW